MTKNITRRKALKVGGAALAVSGAAMLPGMAKVQGTDDKLRALIADLEEYDGDLVMARFWEREEIVARLHTILGEPKARTLEEHWHGPETAEARENWVSSYDRRAA